MKFAENTEADICCPNCNPPRRLIVKTNRHNEHQFLSCPNWPMCDYTRGIPEEWIMRAQGQPGLFDNVPETNKDDPHTYGPDGRRVNY